MDGALIQDALPEVSAEEREAQQKRAIRREAASLGGSRRTSGARSASALCASMRIMLYRSPTKRHAEGLESIVPCTDGDDSPLPTGTQKAFSVRPERVAGS